MVVFVYLIVFLCVCVCSFDHPVTSFISVGVFVACFYYFRVELAFLTCFSEKIRDMEGQGRPEKRI